MYDLKLYINGRLDASKHLSSVPTALIGKPTMTYGEIGMKVLQGDWYGVDKDVMWLKNGPASLLDC